MNTERVESIVTEYHGNNNASLKALLIDACTISAGSPSIAVASRLALQWAKGQPEASSERTGKPDTRGAYGLLGQEMIGWVTPLQHIGSRNVWFVGLLDEKRDDFPPLLRAADRREQDRLGTARHCGRGCHHDRAEAGRRKRTAVPRCCLLTAQSLGLSGRGPQRQT